jgi:CheY-like chemotaxis protein
MQQTVERASLSLKRKDLLRKSYFLAVRFDSSYWPLISIVLLDMSMPVLDGKSSRMFCRERQIIPLLIRKGVGASQEIRKIESSARSKSSTANRPTRIIALTGMSSVEDKQRAFNAGVDG